MPTLDGTNIRASGFPLLGPDVQRRAWSLLLTLKKWLVITSKNFGVVDPFLFRVRRRLQVDAHGKKG